MISYMQGTKFFKKPVISKSVIHKTVMDRDFLYYFRLPVAVSARVTTLMT